MRLFLRVLACSVLLLSAAGCGQTGELYLPDRDDQEKAGQ